MTLFIRRNRFRIYGKIFYRDCLKNFTQEIIFYNKEIIEINKDFNQKRKRRIKARKSISQILVLQRDRKLSEILLENVSKYNKDLDT